MKALILGTGFAAEGHTTALRANGVDVVGIVGRTPHRVSEVQAQLDIPHGSTSWTDSLDQLRPDLVAIATPGGWRREPILQAIERGCHVFCDKPLEVDATRAEALCQAARQAQVKTAFAASFCYQPHCRFARDLVREGKIGTPLEVECVSHYDIDPLIPFHWSHRIATGGGRLSNNFTHKLAIVETILGQQIESVAGEVRNDMKCAPVGQPVHDFRTRGDLAIRPDQQNDVQWENVDSEWSYSILARFPTRDPNTEYTSAVFKHSGLHPRKQSDYIAIYGDQGALFIEGAYAQGPLYFRERKRGAPWQPLNLPDAIQRWLPKVDPDAERNWTALLREFIADIVGRPFEPYLTFEDGLRYQKVADLLRREKAGEFIASHRQS